MTLNTLNDYQILLAQVNPQSSLEWFTYLSEHYAGFDEDLAINALKV